MNAETFIDSFLEGFTKQAEASGVPSELTGRLFSLHVALCKCAQAAPATDPDEASKSERKVLRHLTGAPEGVPLSDHLKGRKLRRLALTAAAAGTGAVTGGVGGALGGHGKLGALLGALIGGVGGHVAGAFKYPSYSQKDIQSAAYSAGHDSVSDYAKTLP